MSLIVPQKSKYYHFSMKPLEFLTIFPSCEFLKFYFFLLNLFSENIQKFQNSFFQNTEKFLQIPQFL